MSSALRPHAATRRPRHYGARRTALHRSHASRLRTPLTTGTHRPHTGTSNAILASAQHQLGRTIALCLSTRTLSTQGERRCEEQPPRGRHNTRRSAQHIILHPRRLNRAFFLTHGVARGLEGNSREALETVGATELVRTKALRNAGEIPIPVAEFFQDTTLATNCAGSFLGGDRGEALKPYLEEDVAQILASGHMEELVRGSIENLEKDPGQHSWATIRAIVGDLPLYVRLRDRFAALLATLNIEEVLKADPVAALQALRAAADQMWNISDDALRARYEAALLSLAEFQVRGPLKSGPGAGGHHDAPDETVIGELVEIALRLAVRPNDPRTTSRVFARLLEGVIRAWPALGANVGYAASKLAFELPAHQLHGVWPLLLYVRASQPQPL
jgi:hypothetical protein